MVSGRNDLLRDRQSDEPDKVTFVELFFDLVFVFAITQLSHYLLKHFTPLGMAQTLVMLAGMWWIWIYTTWVMNELDPEKLPVRALLLTLMGVGLLLSASIPEAFDDRARPFAFAYVAMQLGRTLFFLWAVRGHRERVQNFQRIFVWLLISAIFWLAGAFLGQDWQLLFWGIALTLEIISPSLGFAVPGLGRASATDWDVQGAHFAERCALFVLIALGETILIIGATLGDTAWTSAAIAAAAASLIGSLAFWWLYFDTVAEIGKQRISRSRNPGALARLAYTYIHLLLVAGIVLAATGDEIVLSRPRGSVDVEMTVAVLGGPALFIVGNLLFGWSVTRRMARSHLCAFIALAAIAVAASRFTPLQMLASASLVLVAVAAWEYWKSPDQTVPIEIAR